MKLKQHIFKSMILVSCDECEGTFFIKEVAENLFSVESTFGGESYEYGTVYPDICEAIQYIRQAIAARKIVEDINSPVEKESDLPF